MGTQSDGEVIYTIRGDDSSLEKDLDNVQKKLQKDIEKNADETVKKEKKKDDKIVENNKKSVKKLSDAAGDVGDAWEDAGKTAEKAVEGIEDSLDGIKEADIQIGADTSAAQSQLQSLQVNDIEVNVGADISKAESEIHSISDDKIVDVSVNADTSKAESRIKEISDDKSVKVNIDADTSKAEDAIDDLGDTAENTAGNISKLFSNAMDIVKGDAGDTIASLSPLAGNLSKLTEGVSGTAVAAVGAGVAVAGIGAKAVGTADDVKQAMNQLQSSTGATAEETKKYHDILEKVYGNNYGENFTDIADAISQVTKNMGEMDEGSLQDVTESAFALRDVFEYDIDETTRAAKAMMDNFGIGGKEAMEKIAAGAQNGLDYSGEFLDSISEYSVQFSKMGFSADEMFNIFQAGVDEGAFNLDKIGDSVKENAIRAIDLSDTTADAFSKLGLVKPDLSEPFQKAQDDAEKFTGQIEDLKDKLALAEQKQREFTDKTSESAKMSNAQQIEKYKESLEELETSLQLTNDSIASMSDEMAGEGASMEEFSRKIAAGGEDARDAFDQIMTGIMELEDPLERNAVGTELFGTMWEDLGPEVIATLGDISDAAYGTGEELDNMKEVKYDDLGSNLESLSRSFELLLVPLGQALLPLIVEIIELLIPFVTDCIAPILEALSPLISLITGILVPVLQVLLSTVSEVFGGIASDITSVIGNVISVLQSLVEFVVNVLTGNWQAAWENIKDIFANVVGGFATILKSPLNFMIDLINGLINGINRIKIPDWVPVIGGKSAHITPIPRLKVGMDYVPSDDFPAFLHEGEAVLTKQENALYRQMGGLQGIERMLNAPDYNICESYAGQQGIDYDKLLQVMNSRDSGDIVLTLNGEEFMRWVRSQNDGYKNRTGGYGFFD